MMGPPPELPAAPPGVSDVAAVPRMAAAEKSAGNRAPQDVPAHA